MRIGIDIGSTTFKAALINENGKLKCVIPKEAKDKVIHFILRVTDDGTPSLTSYRRVILSCK